MGWSNQREIMLLSRDAWGSATFLQITEETNARGSKYETRRLGPNSVNNQHLIEAVADVPTISRIK